MKREAKHAGVPGRRDRAVEVADADFLYHFKAGLRAACGGRPRAGSDTTATGVPASPIPLRRTLTSMAIPTFTQRGFWTRIVVFGGSLLLYAWVVRLMTREHSTAGIVLFSLLAPSASPGSS